MKYRKFGNTDLLVSEIGFGAWAIGGEANVGGVPIGWGKSDDSVSKKALQIAVENGINFFDTANFYGLGHSETLIGDALGKNPNLVIATKVGQKVGANSTIEVDYSYEHIIKACENSLRRLQRESIDFYQLHVARLHHLEKGDCVRAMQDLQQAGKIRYWGASLITFAPFDEAEFLLNNGLGNGFQLVLNILNQIALPIAKKAHKQGLGVIARMPLQFGLLSGKFSGKTTFSPSDHRSNRVKPDLIADVNEFMSRHLGSMFSKYGCTPTQLALSFVLSFDEVSTVIPGIRTEQQVVENTSGLFTLEADDLALLTHWFLQEGAPLFEKLKAYA